jgi:hypothetical protein
MSVPLEYHETAYRSYIYDLLFRDVRVTAHPTPFSKEPAPDSSRVIRGVLRFGNSSSNAVAFLWQTGPKKLFLDLNRNGDLTDDPAGVSAGFRTGPQISWLVHHVFTNIHLTFPASSAGAPVLLDLKLLQVRDAPVPLVNVMTRSYRRGKLTVAEREWEVGLLPNISDQPGSFARGQILLRPWEQRDRLFSGWTDSGDSWSIPFEYKNRVLKAAEAFELARRVFFEGHAWRLDWDAEPATESAPFALRFTEEQPALGELKITGQYIERVVLSGGPYVVVLARPGGRVQVPVGSYNQPGVWLKRGEDEAYFNSLPKSGEPTVTDGKMGGVRPISGVTEAGKVVVVDGHAPTVLAVGGPLTNALVVSRHGREMKLKHHLVGAGGGEYKLWENWRKKGDVPPRFTIYRGDQQVVAGKFEFG